MNLLRSKKLRVGLVCGALLFTFSVFINIYITTSTAGQIKTIEAVEKAQAVLLLGAKVYSDGNVSAIVYDRICAAVQLYKTGKADKILVSGDHGTKEYDEVNTIKRKLLQQGIPEENIFLDHAGFSTYDSLVRAREVFRVSSLIIVTQKFHLDRALFISNQVGIPAQGVVADRQGYRGAVWYELREFISGVLAFFNAAVFKPSPRYLGYPIPITGDGRATFD
jgi:vancomycin permeability regulator SanA